VLKCRYCRYVSPVWEAALGLKRQAKILSKGQTDAVLGYLAKTRYPERNRAIFLLSVRAGLRAKEIASLTWAMLTRADQPTLRGQEHPGHHQPPVLRLARGVPRRRLRRLAGRPPRPQRRGHRHRRRFLPSQGG